MSDTLSSFDLNNSKLPDNIVLEVLKNIPLRILLKALQSKNAKIYTLLEKSAYKNNFWQYKIDQYFPYLSTAYPQEYNSNPASLFKKEYRHRKQEAKLIEGTKEVKLELWEKAVLGDLDSVDSTKISNYLYEIAIRSNHFSYLTKLNSISWKTVVCILKSKNTQALNQLILFKQDKEALGKALESIFISFDLEDINGLNDRKFLKILGLAIEANAVDFFKVIFHAYFDKFKNGLLTTSDAPLRLLLLKCKIEQKDEIYNFLQEFLSPKISLSNFESDPLDGKDYFYGWLANAYGREFDCVFQYLLSKKEAVYWQYFLQHLAYLASFETYFTLESAVKFYIRVNCALENNKNLDFIPQIQKTKKDVFSASKNEMIKCILAKHWAKDLTFWQRVWFIQKSIVQTYFRMNVATMLLLMVGIPVLFYAAPFTLGLPWIYESAFKLMLSGLGIVGVMRFGFDKLMLAIGTGYFFTRKIAFTYLYSKKASEYAQETSHTLQEKWAYNKGREGCESSKSWIQSNFKPLLWQKKYRDAYAAGMWDAFEQEEGKLRKVFKI